jgi:glycosyltransferase involved in cell wall biosynthesis
MCDSERAMPVAGECLDIVLAMVKVSVIVPVYNPGRNIKECIASLLRQSLPSTEYEVIFVDDGSTDATPGLLDHVASEHSNVRVEHIPNSGWPGRPRNVGMDLARGEYVYFVDNDDWLGKRALERLCTMASRNDSDVVIGKVVGHGKVVPRTIFRRSRVEVPLDWPPLLRLLTPHKLFRKALLVEHGIRFPEGRRRLEDHMFVVHAYFHARRISVLADYPCYHWVLRDVDKNASMRRLDPVGYFDNVREVLDLVERHTQPGPLRDRFYAHWYRGKMLGRVGGGAFVRREPKYRRELYEEIRRLAQERYGPAVDVWLSFNLRMRSYLLRVGSYEAIAALADFESELRSQVTVRDLRWEENTLTLELEATLGGDRDPLLFVRRGSRILWLPPPKLRDEFPERALDVTRDLRKSGVQLVLHSLADRTEYTPQTDSELVLLRADDTGDAKRPVLIAKVKVDPSDAAAGARLKEGDWEARAIVDVAGFIATTVVTSPARRPLSLRLGTARRNGTPLTLTAMRNGRLRTRAPTMRRYLARRFPGLAARVKRVREGSGEKVAG